MISPKTFMVFKLLSWVVLIGLFIVICVAAIDKRNEVRCDKLEVRFRNDKNLGFIQSKEIAKEVSDADPNWRGQKLSRIKFNLIEKSIKQNEYVKRAELFLDHRHTMNVVVEPKSPIARIHSNYGSYYLSESWDKMPLSSQYSERVIQVSGRVGNLVHPTTKVDSFISFSVKKILRYIDENKIWKHAIDQIYITEQGKVEFVLVFCKPFIQVGYVDEEFEKRMKKMYLFFKTVSRHHSIDDYDELDFQFSQQVVARKKISQ